MRLSVFVLAMAALLALTGACNQEAAESPAPAPKKVEPVPSTEAPAPSKQKEGPDPAAAEKAEQDRLAGLAKAFNTKGTHSQLLKAILSAASDASLPACKESACSAQELGLKAGGSIDALRGKSEQILRLNQQLKALGSNAPSGILELPLPANDSIEMTATGAPTSVFLPLETIIVSQGGVSAVLRPVAQLDSDALLAGGQWPGKQIMSAVQLQEAEKAEDFQPLVDAMTALRDGATAAAKAISESDAPEREKGQWAALLVVNKGTSAGLLAAVVKGLQLSGYRDLRYLRGGTARSVLAAPSTPELIPPERAGRSEKRALLVNLTKKGADLFDPVGGQGKATQEDGKVALPKEARRWYKGARLFKTQVNSTEVATLVQALRSVKQRTSAGTVVLLTANAGVSAERLLQSASAIADANGPPTQQKIAQVFPGLACKDELPSAESDRCVSLFPIVLAEVKVPFAKGLTDTPAKVEKAAPKPKEEPKAKPKLGMCDRGNIAKVIRSRRGAFRFCYTRQLQLHQDLKGRVVVRLTIDESGRVVAAGSSGSMANKKVHACVLKEARKLKFKPPTEGGRCVVNWPFKFRPNE